MKRFLPVLLLAAAWCMLASPARAQDVVKLELQADVASVAPGGKFKLAVRAEIAPQWHIYWRNPGESGLPTLIQWTAPDGFEVGPTQDPVPHRYVQKFTETLSMVSHTFENEAYFIAEVTAPAGLEIGSQVKFAASVDWQACKEVCTNPTTTPVSLTLAVAETAQASGQAAAIAAAWAKGQGLLPRAEGTSAKEEGQLAVVASLPAGLGAQLQGDLYLLATDAALLDAGEDQIVAVEGDQLSLWATLSDPDAALPATVEGFVVGPEGTPALWVSTKAIGAAVISPESAGTSAVANVEAPGATTAYPPKDSPEADEIRAAIKEIASWRNAGAKQSWLLMVLFAFLGGMILNLMPCVFPVLGIKIMGFVQQAGSDSKKIRQHGLIFGAGVILSLWVLVGILFVVRAAGRSAGWGFQLQEPWFVVFLIVILFVFALNLAGLFEIGASLTGVGSGLQQKHGVSGSFFSGVLAVLVATPCTGPFMAPALGFALSEAYHVGFLIFTALGVGLALPYVVLSYFPALIQKLPRPGPWMVTFKQFMSFPLFATVVWLVAVLGKTQGGSAVTLVLFGLVLLAFGFWIYGRYSTPVKKARTRWIARAATAGCAGLFVVMAAKATSSSANGGAALVVNEERFGLRWENFDPRKIVEHRRAGRAVFIDFTASW